MIACVYSARSVSFMISSSATWEIIDADTGDQLRTLGTVIASVLISWSSGVAMMSLLLLAIRHEAASQLFPRPRHHVTSLLHHHDIPRTVQYSRSRNVANEPRSQCSLRSGWPHPRDILKMAWVASIHQDHPIDHRSQQASPAQCHAQDAPSHRNKQLEKHAHM